MTDSNNHHPLAAPGAVQRSAFGVPEVTVGWLAAHREDVVLVDCREADELVGPLGALDEIVHVPMSDFAARVAALDPSSPTAIICRSGARSGRAALALEQHGFAQVVSVAGGMIAWRDLNRASHRPTQEAPMSIEIRPFFDDRTWTMTYVVFDPETRDACVIDPVLDYEPASSKIWTESADAVVAFLREEGLRLHLILETHAHADHLSGSQIIKRAFPDAVLAVGERITVVQETFKSVFDLPADFPTDGRQFDRLLTDGETVEAGSLRFEVIFTPGHTPACATYRFGDAIFTGDALFMPDMGTGRCDFPAGSAEDLYDSIHGRLYALPDTTRVFVGHDYMPDGRPLAWETTIGAEKAGNKQLTADTTREEFVKFRQARDATLSAPQLLFQSVQVNVDAGALPKAEANEVRYLKIPINVFRPEPNAEIELKDI